ncbi:MAG: hypothetical protein HY907_10855 [Deltaproteobacteria bacterium]|nr:hypothetical protein [Deltaproteobacteria bacterium]
MQDTVSSALGEILGIEQDRVRAETEARRRAEEAERRELEEAELRRVEEVARRAREEARLRVEGERAEREQAERREHERRLAELRVRRETEARAQLAEEELRLRHERELAAVAAARGRAPAWAWVVMAVLLVAGAAVGVLSWRAGVAADEVLAAAAARHEGDRASWQGERQRLVAEMRELRGNAAALAATVREDQRTIEGLEGKAAQAAADHVRVGALETENGGLARRVAELESQLVAATAAACRPAGERHPPPPPPPPPPRTEIQCVNAGTPLEECFPCPGERRCRPRT